MLKNKNFKLIKKEKINDIQSEYFEFEYQPLGTKIVWVKNNDKDRAFEIAFRTPPSNNKGINHILEHSVLRGSRKYPFEKEEVFAELIKKSVSTFLNAATYPDKTVYPFSSNNKNEFMKILDVYLDAVFFPKVLENENIFKQEGWRYDIDENKKIFFNGVVFNEMKGRYSDVDINIWESITKNLFKDTIYSLEYGGDPKEIIKLKYKELADYHKKYYHPSNSIIYFYGDLDINKIFNYLEEEFLSNFKKKKINSKIKQQKKHKKSLIKTERFFTPDIKNNSILSISFIMGKSSDRRINIESGLLRSILFEGNSSLVKTKLLKSGLVKKVEAWIESEIGQTCLVVNIKGIDFKNINKVEKIFWNSLKEVVDNGIKKSIIDAQLGSYELALKAKNLNIGRGLVFGNQIITHWNYDIENLEDYLKTDYVFNELKDNLKKNSYLEKIIKKQYIKNNNKLTLKLKADSSIDIEKEIKNSLDKLNKKPNKENILEEINNFKKWEKIEEKEENLELIKPVNKIDFPKSIKDFKYKISKNNGVKYIFTKIKTKDIESFVLSFNTEHLNEEDIQYLEIISKLLTKIDFKTNNKDSDEILELRKKLLLTFSFSQSFFENKSKKVLRILNVGFNGLSKNRKEVLEFINLFLNEAIFDKKGIKQLVEEEILDFENNLSYNGNYMANLINMSNLEKSNYLNEKIKGISYYKFLKNFNIDKDFDKLNKLYKKVFLKNNITISYTAEKENNKIFELLKLNVDKNKKIDIKFKAKKIKHAYAFNTLRNSFNSLIINFKKNKSKDYVTNVMGELISYDYLWKKIREEGGAYGSKMIDNNNGHIAFVSYMDSRISGTYKDYLNLDKYLDNLKLKNKDIDSMIAKELSRYLKPQTELIFAIRNLFYELKGEKDRVENYKNTFGFNNKDIFKFSKEFKKNKKNISKVTIGNMDNIEKDKKEFDKIEKF